MMIMASQLVNRFSCIKLPDSWQIGI